MPSTPIHQLRAICLALPEAVEKETWDAPTFRVRDKIFAMVHQVGGQTSLWCKAPVTRLRPTQGDWPWDCAIS